MTLACGCTPDASGYGYCGTCVTALRKKIWLKMTEGERNYDRQFGAKQSAQLDDLCQTEPYEGCSCHINPPCSYCVDKGTDDE